MVEYWSANDFEFPSSTVRFAFKTDTDLYEFAKRKTLPVSLEFSPDGRLFATMAHDKQVRISAKIYFAQICSFRTSLTLEFYVRNQVRIFRFLTGKVCRTYNESLGVFVDAQKDNASPYRLDSIDFGRRYCEQPQVHLVG